MSSPAYYDGELPSLVLPAELEQELASNVRRTFSHAVKDLLGPAPSASSLRRAVRAVNDCIQTALAAELRDHNERASSHRLPTELWVMIWAHLPMLDCIAVTHVCHFWRATAVASRRLWSVLEFRSSAHGEGCDCDVCIACCKQDFQSFALLCIHCSQPRPTGQSTNPNLVQASLVRSAELPLAVELNLDGEYPCWTSVQVLAELLDGDSARVQSFQIALWRPSILSDIFETLPDFPAVQSVRIDICVFTENDMEFFLNSTRFTSLRHLQISVGDYTALLDALLRVPNISELHIEISDGFFFPRADSDAQHTKFPESMAAHLRTLTVSNILPGSLEHLLLNPCRATNPRQLALHYRTPSLYPFTLSLNTVPLGFEIFNELEDAVQITIAESERGDGSCEIEGSDGRGSRREVVIHRSAIYGLWKSVQATSVTSLDVHLRLWKGALATLENPLPAVRWLTLRVHIHSDERLGLDAELIRARPLLPALECVTLSALDAPPRMAIVVSERLTGFLRALRDDGGIRVLVLRGLCLREVNPDLLKIVQDVRDAPGFVQSHVLVNP
ncbi:hypothetical protein EXIGLDRAFT_845752 [Exidia glandulosa HHB12029]|uniref:F-box domain-containing protein n=1 Tax=Exidia glandulosa HHB12029 TaxID=1314781 RepID=A0A165BAW7_EXIGL|nr:hypothetical protein EXIGLDRAFT_845752 [Exidia glandulosa HHB12029]